MGRRLRASESMLVPMNLRRVINELQGPCRKVLVVVSDREPPPDAKPPRLAKVKTCWGNVSRNRVRRNPERLSKC
jgi:hypothetical protein